MLAYAPWNLAMPKYRSRATLQAGRRLDINELRRSGIRTGEFGVTFPGDGAPGTLNVFMEERGGSCLHGARGILERGGIGGAQLD